MENAANTSEKRVYSVALRNLVERYIDPIDAGATMTNGLARLASLDDRMAVLRRDGTVVVTYEGGKVAEYAVPAGDDVDDWAALGATVIRDARVTSDALAEQRNDDVYRTVFAGLIGTLDSYSRYLAPDDARRSRATRDGYGGIGITIGETDGTIVIRRVLDDRPAAEAGLKARDRITHVDGKSILGLNMHQVIGLLRGDVGDPVRLTVLRQGNPAPLELDVVRDHIVPPSVRTKLNGSILEIRLSVFNQGTVGAVRKEIVKAVRKKGSRLSGIVLDMRNNPGGLLDQAIAVADLFMSRGRIVSTEGRHPDSNQIFDATPGQVLDGMPMAVLINGRSASAAEIVAVALRDSGRAAVIGSTSFGKGTVQTIVRLPNRGEMNITWARIVAPTGQTLAHQGIVPTICTNVDAGRLKKLRGLLTEDQRSAEFTGRPGFAAQARMPHYSSNRRAACPPSEARPAHDLDIARLVLANRKVYAASIAHPAPNIARR